MIDPDMRNAVFRLHQEGMSLREISRRLHVSRNAVRAIVRQQGKLVRKERQDTIQIDPELLERLYRECDGAGSQCVGAGPCTREVHRQILCKVGDGCLGRGAGADASQRSDYQPANRIKRTGCDARASLLRRPETRARARPGWSTTSYGLRSADA